MNATNKPSIIGICFGLIGASLVALLVTLHHPTLLKPIWILAAYAVMWVIFTSVHVVNAHSPTIGAFIGSIIYFTIVGFTIMILRICPGIIRIFDNSISYWLITSWPFTFFPGGHDIDGLLEKTTYANNSKIALFSHAATKRRNEFPFHFIIPFLTISGETIEISENVMVVKGTLTGELADIIKVLKRIQLISIFIIMTFSILVANLVSFTAIQLAANQA